MRLSAKSLSAAISQTEALVHLKTHRGEKPNIRSSISELEAIAAEHTHPNYKTKSMKIFTGWCLIFDVFRLTRR